MQRKGCIVYGVGWHEGVESVAKPLRDFPGGTAVMVMDEPNDRDEHYATIEKRIAWVHKNHPGVLAFANLSILEFNHARYVRQCKPDVFIWDTYPMMSPKGKVRIGFYLHLLNVGLGAARKHKLPYWMTIQGHGGGDGGRLRVPDQADMRFLLFSALGHGVIGFHVFGYHGKGGGHRDMVYDTVNRHGNEPAEQYEDTYMSRAYYALRDAAPEVQTLGRALLNLRTKGRITYAGAVPENDRRLAPFAAQGALRSVKILAGATESVLVSFFDDRKGEEYFMIVNLVHGRNMSKMDGSRMVQLAFDEKTMRIERLNRLTGRVEVLRTKGDKKRNARVLDVHLEGGTGDLFKWSNGRPWDLLPAEKAEKAGKTPGPRE